MAGSLHSITAIAKQTQCLAAAAASSHPLARKEFALPERRRKCMEREPHQEDFNWNAVLGMMALALVSFGLYGAAVGTYFTLTS